MTRMNLNTFARHGVFDNEVMVKLIANRLANADAVKRARVFPYQLLMAFKAAGGDVPNLIQNAIQDAMEVATENIPALRAAEEALATWTAPPAKDAKTAASCIERGDARTAKPNRRSVINHARSHSRRAETTPRRRSASFFVWRKHAARPPMSIHHD